VQAKVLAACAGITEQDTTAQAHTKVAETLRCCIRSPQTQAWLLPRLNRLFPEENAAPETDEVDAQEIVVASVILLTVIARMYSIVLAVTDLNRGDEVLVDYVRRLANSALRARLLVLVTGDVRLLDRLPDWGVGRQNGATLMLDEIRVAPSGPENLHLAISLGGDGGPSFARRSP
jgi:hypothetical protein